MKSCGDVETEDALPILRDCLKSSLHHQDTKAPGLHARLPGVIKHF